MLEGLVSRHGPGATMGKTCLVGKRDSVGRGGIGDGDLGCEVLGCRGSQAGSESELVGNVVVLGDGAVTVDVAAEERKGRLVIWGSKVICFKSRQLIFDIAFIIGF